MSKIFVVCLTAFTLFLAQLPFVANQAMANDQVSKKIEDKSSETMEMEHDDDCKKMTDLTKKQQAELDELYKNLHDDYVSIVQKYAEFGAISKEELKHKEKAAKHHLDMMKKHGYMICDDDDDEEDDDDRWDD